jgi:hypothetical protein
MTESKPKGFTIVQSSLMHFWTVKQIVTNLVILALASIAAYLQYYLYPLIMARPLDPVSGLGFGETNISLRFSFLTFQYTATRCMGSSCSKLVGIPAFDFFQVMIIALVFVNLLHYVNTRKK